tara:strand:- start:18400 stop:19422 length:1023 start_codon:yes stop_codon:yes gene_type:complete
MGKAGSSTIQAFCNENREHLFEQNVCYPKDILNGDRLGGDNHKCLAMYCVDYRPNHIVFKQQRVQSPNQKEVFNKKVIELYRAQLSSLPENCHVVLSAEHFWSEVTQQSQVMALANLFELLDLHVERIVIYLREQSEWVESFVHQKLTEGTATSFTLPYTLSNLEARLNYFNTLELWSSVFSHSAIEARLFKREAFPEGELLLDFFNAAGLPIDCKNLNLDSEQYTTNESSLSVPGYQLLAAINELQKKGSDKSQFILKNRKAIIQSLKKNYFGTKSKLLTRQEMATIRELFKGSNQNLQSKYGIEFPLTSLDVYRGNQLKPAGGDEIICQLTKLLLSTN